MISNLLPSDLFKVHRLPSDVLARNPISIANEQALKQLAEGLKYENQPLPNFKPQSVELFLNDLEEPVFASDGDEVVAGSFEFFTIEQPMSAVLVIDDIPRYVELNGREEVNSLGDVILPDALIDEEAQLRLMINLIQRLNTEQ